MPVPPTPREIYCPQCGWQQIWAPASDAITHLPPTSCPCCKHTELQTRPASVASTLRGLFQRWLLPS